MEQKTIRAIFVNGSPCKKWNTAKMLESAMKGALTSLLLLFATPGLHAKSWTPAEVKSVVRQVNTYWQQHNAAEVRAFWDHAAYHTGNMEVYNLLQDEQMQAYSLRWAEHNRWQGATERDRTKWKYKHYGEGQDFVLFGDWQICFQTYIDLYRLFTATRAGRVMGGTVIYATPMVTHAQYISESPEGKQLRVIDRLFDYILHEMEWPSHYFDFGTSNEDDGRVLVEPLIYQKEGFGGRGICYDWYEWTL